MTPAAFAKIALSLDGAVEGAHGGHADFRAGGKVFATLGYPDKDWGMVKLAPEQQQMLVAAEPAMFVPVKGTWGLRGATSVRSCRGRCPDHAQRAHHGVAERDRAQARRRLDAPLHDGAPPRRMAMAVLQHELQTERSWPLSAGGLSQVRRSPLTV